MFISFYSNINRILSFLNTSQQSLLHMIGVWKIKILYETKRDWDYFTIQQRITKCLFVINSVNVIRSRNLFYSRSPRNRRCCSRVIRRQSEGETGQETSLWFLREGTGEAR